MTGIADEVGRAYRAYARGEIVELLDMLDPDVELHEEPEIPDSEVRRGRDAVAGYFTDTAERWSRFSIDITGIEEVDDAIVVVRGVMSAAGALSGAQATASFTHVIEFRDGKATRIRFFFDEQQALEAARAAAGDKLTS